MESHTKHLNEEEVEEILTYEDVPDKHLPEVACFGKQSLG